MTQPFDGRRECAVESLDLLLADYRKALAAPENYASAASLSANIRGLETLRREILERPSEIYSGDLIESLFKTVERIQG